MYNYGVLTSIGGRAKSQNPKHAEAQGASALFIRGSAPLSGGPHRAGHSTRSGRLGRTKDRRARPPESIGTKRTVQTYKHKNKNKKHAELTVARPYSMQFVWSSSSPRGGVLFIIALHSQGVSGKRGTKDEEVATKVRKEYRIYKSKANRTVAAGPSRR